MTRCVALFRGINVGRTKRIAMADLRGVLESLGYTRVRTLLNSGNAVFDVTNAASGAPASAPLRHAQVIRAAVHVALKVDAHVVVKSAKDIAAIVAGNSFATDETSRLLVAMTQDAKALDALRERADAKWSADEAIVGPHAAYVWCPDGVLESKAAKALLTGLAETGTTRNWATVLKIHELLQAPG